MSLMTVYLCAVYHRCLQLSQVVSLALKLGERSRRGVVGGGEVALRSASSLGASAGTPKTGFATGGVASVAFADESASARRALSASSALLAQARP
eukprot:2293119-Pleurochrysis_carterae.AAC.1